MSKVREYVENLDDDTLIEIIKDYEKFEEEGAIGNCTLRLEAANIIKLLGAHHDSIVMWMELLVKEVYRKYALEYIKQQNKM